MIIKRLFSWGLFILLIGGWGVGPQAGAEDDSSFAFSVRTPALEVVESADGFHKIKLVGFGTPERRSGAPDIPTKTVLVAIPPDASPRLEVRPLGERLLPGIRPSPVPTMRSKLSREDALLLARPGLTESERMAIGRRSAFPVFEPSPRYYSAERIARKEPAWLGETGFLREQRYVEVHLSPVSYDPALQALRIHDALEVTVHFDGAAPISDGPPAADRFEAVYRGALINYEQGRRFRLEEREAATLLVSRASAGSRDAARQRITISEDGLVRLDYNLLFDAGFLDHDPANWKLTNRGVAIPLDHVGDGDGTLEPGEWVQFYGQALDDEPKTVLNTDFPGTDVDLFEARDFTDKNIYFLTHEDEPQAVLQERDSTPTHTRIPPDHFEAVAHEEIDDAFRPLGAADPWCWGPTLVSTSTPDASRSDVVQLPGLHSGTEPARVLVYIRGTTEDFDVNPDHTSRVTLKNGSGATLATDQADFNGRTLHLHDFTWSYPGTGDTLTAPALIVLEAVPVTGADNYIILDWIEIRYRREFSVIGGTLEFEWPDEDAEFVVEGLADDDPLVWEITLAPGEEVVEPVRLTGLEVTGSSPPYTVRFRVDNDPAITDGEPRRFLVADSSGDYLLDAADFEADTVSGLRDNANQADIIVIGHRDVLNVSAGGPLDQWLAYRSSAAGGSLSSIVAEIRDVQDEFNHGLAGPTAIREFLRWVMSDLPGEGWAAPKPAYVLLVGDGAINYKRELEVGNFVPTQLMFKDMLELGYYASDNIMAAVVGDDNIADLVMARIPVWSSADADLVLTKILDYAQSPPAGDWSSRALFISDRGKHGNNPGESLQFEMINEDSQDRMQIPPYAATQLRYWTDYYDDGLPDPVNAMRGDIKDSINIDGAAVVQYVGHGNHVVWSDDAFFDERYVPRDTEDLVNGGRLPWLVALNCMTGAFHLREFTMGEDWLRVDGGGAIAVFSPTGLSYNYISEQTAETLWSGMFGPTKEREIGILAMAAWARLCGQGSIEPCQQYVLLGDPAMSLALRHVEPPTAPWAVAGNGQVDINWTASVTPGAVYDVYRTGSLAAGSYTRINASPVAVTSYTDDTAINAATYYYYVVAKDGEGFESAWSNFNSDCGVSGPDCLSATPLNPDPPAAPTGVAIADPGLGNMLTVTWSANSEDDLDHYTVHYGTESGVYTSTSFAGDSTIHSLTALEEGQEYFVAITATNTSALTSAFSAEVTDFPVFGPGLRAPDFIADLTLTADGDDLLLAWSEVTTDIYGKPMTVAGYEIYRGVPPELTNDGLTLHDSCAPPCSSYRDIGAYADGGEYYYRVRAIDGLGNSGGLGSELPESTELRLQWSQEVPGDLVLTWSPVLLDLDGNAVALSHYAVYSSDAPFTREDIRDGSLPEPTTLSATTLQFTPPPQDRYYSVLAVDTRGNVSPF